jgi:hypothetical protein
MLVVRSLRSFPFVDDECKQNAHALLSIESLLLRRYIIFENVDFKRKKRKEKK